MKANKSEIIVYNRKYKIKTVEKVTIEGNDNVLAGSCDYYNAEIQLAKALPAEITPRVLAHEVAHAALYESGLHNMFDEKQTEAICDLVGSVAEIVKQRRGVK